LSASWTAIASGALVAFFALLLAMIVRELNVVMH
jgi:hypothetical protein